MTTSFVLDPVPTSMSIIFSIVILPMRLGLRLFTHSGSLKLREKEIRKISLFLSLSLLNRGSLIFTLFSVSLSSHFIHCGQLFCPFTLSIMVYYSVRYSVSIFSFHTIHYSVLNKKKNRKKNKTKTKQKPKNKNRFPFGSTDFYTGTRLPNTFTHLQLLRTFSAFLF